MPEDYNMPMLPKFLTEKDEAWLRLLGCVWWCSRCPEGLHLSNLAATPPNLVEIVFSEKTSENNMICIFCVDVA